MFRLHKKPDFYPVKRAKEFTEAIAEAYIFPLAELSDAEGHMPFNYIVTEFNITMLKVRKLLITAGEYHTELSNRVRLDSHGSL